MIHYMKLNDGPYIAIKYGKKDIEMRLNDEKRRALNIGDKIIFTNLKTADNLEVKIIDLHVYSNFGGIYNVFLKERLGYKLDDFSSPDDMVKYYSNEEILKYGVVGIEIRKI